MQTVYDWVTIFIFAGLITLFLHRSNQDQPQDKLIEYIPAAAGCAIANFLGNSGQTAFALAVIAAILAYVWFVLKPLRL